MHPCLKYVHNDIVPNAFPDRAWGATWGMLQGQGNSDNEIDYTLYTEDYEHPIDQTVREGENWDWKGHSSARAFGFVFWGVLNTLIGRLI